MSVENSLSRLSSALKKLEKTSASKPKSTAAQLRGQQDLFSSNGISGEKAKGLIEKIDHTIATVETMLKQERA